MRDPYAVAVIDQRKAEALDLLRRGDSFVLFTVSASGVEVAAALEITAEEYLKLAEAAAVTLEKVGRDVVAGMNGAISELEHGGEASLLGDEPKPAARPTDHVWEALTDHFGTPTNDAERARMNRAVKLVKQSLRSEGVDVKGDGGLVASEVGRRCRAALLTFELYSPAAIALNWTRLGREQ